MFDGGFEWGIGDLVLPNDVIERDWAIFAIEGFDWLRVSFALAEVLAGFVSAEAVLEGFALLETEGALEVI